MNQKVNWLQPLSIANMIVSVPLNIVGIMTLLDGKVGWKGPLLQLVNSYKALSEFIFEFLFGWLDVSVPDWIVHYIPICIVFYLSLKISAFIVNRKRAPIFLRYSDFKKYMEWHLEKINAPQRDNGKLLKCAYLLGLTLETIKIPFSVFFSPIYFILLISYKLIFAFLVFSMLVIYIAIIINLYISIQSMFFLFVVAKGASSWHPDSNESLSQWLNEKVSNYKKIRVALFQEIIDPTFKLYFILMSDFKTKLDKSFLNKWVPIVGFQYITALSVGVVLILLIGLNNYLFTI